MQKQVKMIKNTPCSHHLISEGQRCGAISIFHRRLFCINVFPTAEDPTFFKLGLYMRIITFVILKLSVQKKIIPLRWPPYAVELS